MLNGRHGIRGVRATVIQNAEKVQAGVWARQHEHGNVDT